MNIIQLNDYKAVPDIIQEYSNDLRDSAMPLCIDNGSYKCRVGWANKTNPSLIFRNVIAKPRKDRSKKDSAETSATPTIQIGNDIVNIETLRFQLKTQFDRNVVTHYQIQEHVFDYIFNHLGIDSDGRVPHPIILTECFSNPNYNRNLMSELLFECYDTPSVCYGIDSLFSFHQNKNESGLVISCGYHSTHVIPVLNGKMITEKTRRINIGGYHMITYMYRLLQLKYPVHINAITLSRIEELLHEHSSIVVNYIDDLKKWASFDFYEENVKKIQLPFTVAPPPTVLTAEQKFEKKKELSRRLGEINARKREEKLAEDENLLQTLSLASDFYEDGNIEEYTLILNEQSIANFDDLEKAISNVSGRIERAKIKIASIDSGIVVPVVVEEKQPTIPQPPLNTSIEDWITQVKLNRTTLLERRHVRRQRKQDLAKRRTAAAQERMRIISQLARKEKGTDDFGMRDEDWDVYKAIRRGDDSDSEVENEKLLEFEEVLRHHDPLFEEPQMHQGNAQHAEYHQLHVGVEAIRAPELLFQPSMIGSSEAGLAETINYVLKLFTSEEQLLLANNVFLTGGISKFPGLKDRLTRELMEIRPFQSPHKVNIANDPSVDAWRGAQLFANSPIVSEYQITKAMYKEMGGDYLKEHFASNCYYPTPAPIVTEIME